MVQFHLILDHLQHLISPIIPLKMLFRASLVEIVFVYSKVTRRSTCAILPARVSILFIDFCVWHIIWLNLTPINSCNVVIWTQYVKNILLWIFISPPLLWFHFCDLCEVVNFLFCYSLCLFDIKTIQINLHICVQALINLIENFPSDIPP